MPHVVVKLTSGRTEAQKQRLTDAVTQALTSSLGIGEDAVSVALEEVAPDDWAEQVYRPEIQPQLDTLYKKPGYDPL